MPKFRKLLSAILALWLCAMLVVFTYTWVSRNWTPSIKSDDINIASSGALVISVTGRDVQSEVPLNDVISYGTFTFRQVSSQDGVNFFWKDYSPQLTNKDNPTIFDRIEDNDTHRADYIEARFCLQLDDSLIEEGDLLANRKYIFIHPETDIVYTGDCGVPLEKAIRISLTFEDEKGEEKTVILGNLRNDMEVVNAEGSNRGNDLYRAVANLPYASFEDNVEGAVDYQTVYDLHYFNCGRDNATYDEENPWADSNYTFIRNPDRALFTLNPGTKMWVTMRIWLEGQDEDCVEMVAGQKFNLVLKFDSAFVNVEDEQ